MAVVWPKLEIRVVPAEEFCRNERAVEEKIESLEKWSQESERRLKPIPVMLHPV